MIRFLFKLKCQTGRLTGEELLSEQVLDAEDIIRQAHYVAYTEEHVAMAEKKAHQKPNQLTEPSPQLDENGLICLEGRLIFAEHVPYMT